MRDSDFSKGEGRVSSQAAERWREGRPMRDAGVKRGRSPFQEAKRLGISPCELNEIELRRRSKWELLDKVQSSDGKKRNTARYDGEIHVGCGKRRDGRWNVIVIPPAGGRGDVRIVQDDLELMQAVEIAGQLRKRVREFPQAETYSADDLLALCVRLPDTIKRT
jgi:hypothetical protein